MAQEGRRRGRDARDAREAPQEGVRVLQGLGTGWGRLRELHRRGREVGGGEGWVEGGARRGADLEYWTTEEVRRSGEGRSGEGRRSGGEVERQLVRSASVSHPKSHQVAPPLRSV